MRGKRVAHAVRSWEFILCILIILANIGASFLSEYYLNVRQLFYSTRHFVIPGIMALGLAVVVILGEIDLSLPSILAVGTVIFAQFSKLEFPIWFAGPIVICVCSLLGALNGWLVSKLSLPSMAVTLGSSGAFRGLAFIIGSEVGYTGFGSSYLWLGKTKFFNRMLPLSFLLLVMLAAIVFFLVHKTTFGRKCYAIGNNIKAAAFSGIRIHRQKILAYALAGGMSAIGAWIFIGQYGSARGDNADGMILFIVTAVVLGGIDISGGKGGVSGVVLALFLLGTLNNGMGLANIGGPIRTVVVGVLLVTGVLLPNLLKSRIK